MLWNIHVHRKEVLVNNKPFINFFQIFYIDQSIAPASPQKVYFPNEVLARTIKINITGFSDIACLKMELIGCPRRGDYGNEKKFIVLIIDNYVLLKKWIIVGNCGINKK